MLTFTEEILLLMLDDEGRLPSVREDTVKYIIVAASLMELAFANRIDTDPQQLFVVDGTPTGNAMLDSILERISEGGEKTMDTKAWIDTLAWTNGESIREQALDSLVERGILEKRDKMFLRLFHSRRYPTIDGRAEREARLRISDALLSDDIPTPRDVALICLVDACNLLDDIFSREELERASDRVRQLRKMDLIGREVAGAVTEIERVMMMAAAAHWHWY